MSIIFRVDGNNQIGIGHIMRCLTLACQLQKFYPRITFICAQSSQQLAPLIEPHNIDIQYLPPNTDDATATQQIINKLPKPDWLIIDHYKIDHKWESLLAKSVTNILVIDDLANRKHQCDILLDQNFFTNPTQRYNKLVPKNCTKLLGPAFALLRNEFSAPQPHTIKENAQNILISFGGADQDNVTGKILSSLSKPKYQNLNINVIMGQTSQHLNTIQNICNNHTNITLHCQINNMAQIMSQADLFIGAGGATTWERLALGLPGLIISIADNQTEICQNLAQEKLISYLGTTAEFNNKTFEQHFDKLCQNQTTRQTMSTKGQQIVDGRGTKKVAAHLKSSAIQLKPVTKEDSQNIYNWRTHPKNTQFSTNNKTFTFESHQQWLEQTLNCPNTSLLIAYINNTPLGITRFDHNNQETTISIYLVPQQHNKNLGTPLLIASKNWLKQNHPKIKTIHATILKNNIASQKIFSDCGFIKDISKGESFEFCNYTTRRSYCY